MLFHGTTCILAEVLAAFSILTFTFDDGWHLRHCMLAKVLVLDSGLLCAIDPQRQPPWSKDQSDTHENKIMYSNYEQ